MDPRNGFFVNCFEVSHPVVIKETRVEWAAYYAEFKGPWTGKYLHIVMVDNNHFMALHPDRGTR